MRKTALLNSGISTAISKMGHFDTIAIADAGLPTPPGVERIDVAITKGVPTFLSVFYAVLEELHVQKAMLAREICEGNPTLYSALCEYFERRGIHVEMVSHETLKTRTAQCRAVVRTGEATPYANVILESGVIF